MTIVPGCSTARARLPQAASIQNLDSNSVPSNVVIVRGNVGYWPDCNSFVENLNREDCAATVIRGWEVNRTADKIVATRQSGDEPRPMVLIGYSRGANDAIRLSRRLQNNGIQVDMLILMETAAQDSVPANVAACLNIYKSSPIAEDWVPAFQGLPVTVESPHTELVNYNLRYHDETASATSLVQFAVCQNPNVQGMIADRVAQTLRPEKTVAEPERDEAQLAGQP